MMSIRNRLLLWLLAPLIPGALVFMWAVYGQVRSATEAAHDQVLLGSALAIADRVVLENKQLNVDVPYAALQMLTRAAEERVFYAVLSFPEGETITGYKDMPQIDLSLADTQFSTQNFRGETVRLVAIRNRALSYGQEQEFAVLVAETTGRRSQIVLELLRLSIIAGICLIIGTLIVALTAIHFSLRPLSLLADAISERSSQDLRPIVKRVPSEAKVLGREINALLDRLDSALESHKSFVRATSHQLRTPLAELKTEIQLAADLDQPLDKPKLAARIDTLSRLIEQLLLMSRVEDQNLRHDMMSKFDLVQAGQEAVTRYWKKANKMGIDLGLETQSQTEIVFGYPALLDEALNNLIENIMNHATGAKKASVVVGKQSIALIDDAPGTKNLLSNLEGSGSGRFGLSIVRQIAQLNRAKLEELPTGLKINWHQEKTMKP